MGTLTTCVLFVLLGLSGSVRGAAPVISSVPGSVSLRRDQTADVRVFELVASDPDNDAFTCTLGPAASPFRVEKRPSDTNYWVYFIYSAPPADVLPNDVYELQVTCSDATETSSPGDVTINVYNNKAPVFSPHESLVSVPEDETVGSVLFTFTASEPDSETMYFTWTVDPSTSTAFFELDSATLDVKLATGQSFNFETDTNSYIITCVASDGSLDATSSVTIAVYDVNEAPSLPATIPVTVDEGAPNTMSVFLTSFVTDEDTSDSHTFSISASTYSSYFAIDAAGTTLTNAMTLDFEGDPPSPVTVKVVATDTGGKTATSDVVVTLNDVNDNDPVFQPASYSFPGLYAGMTAGVTLGTVTATDDDSTSNGQIDFSLVAGSDVPSGKFLVTSDGRVQLNADVTETYGTVMTLQVKAVDRGATPRSSTTAVTVEWNKAPDITSLPNSANVPEDPTVSRLLHTLVTSDFENDTVTCLVTAVDPPLAAFEVQNIPGTTSQGVYYNGAVDLDRSTQSSYVVTVTARDDKGGQTSRTLNINVTPNLPPTSSCAGTDGATAPSSSAIGDVIYALTVSDTENDVITITATSSPDSGSFQFFSASKQVKVIRDLRNEAVTSHTMTLSISDGANPAVTCVLSITITAPNLPPVFANHPNTIPVEESVPALTSLFSFDITDNVDSFNDVISVFWEVSPLADEGFFEFDDTTFEVKLASGQAFDYETKTTQFVITCTASDGFLQTTGTVTITIIDTNDPPYFDSDTVLVTVQEGEASAISFLPTYNVHDPDSDTLNFDLVPGVLDADLFTINTATGQLTNVVELDRDLDAPDSVSVQVTADDGQYTATVQVTVYLEDVNDNAPKFNQTAYEFKVGLSTSLGALVGAVSTSDDDDGDNAVVDLVMTAHSPPSPQYFELEADGSIHLIRELDVDYGTPFSLDVEARDRGTPALTSTTVVKILWNEGPKILNLPSEAYIHEDAAIRQELYSLQVVDAESDQFVCVKDKIEPASTLFIVQDDAGANEFKVYFTADGKLSASDVAQFELTVRCFDANAEAKQKLTIIVQPNTAPLLPCPVTVTVNALNTEANDEVHSIGATDNEGDVLEYKVTSPEFYVGTYTGILRAKKSLRAATTDQYSVDVSVSDNSHTAFCTYVVLLSNRNTASEFSNLNAVVEIPEDAAAGSALYTISVADPNVFGTGVDITWSSADKNKFTLETSGLTATLKLGTGQELDYESNKIEYAFTFTASDGYLTSAQKTLTLKVTQVNEPPYFERDPALYYATFLEVNDPPESRSLGCRVTDPDDGDVLTYELSGPNAQLFTMDTCELTLATEYDLDSGLGSPVTLTLTVRDKQGLSATASIVVTITEINDNTPEFAGPVSLSIEHGMLAGDTIGAAVATDLDAGTNGAVSYSIVTEPDNPDEADKYINFLSDGTFVLRQSMDGLVGSGENFQYVVMATDAGSPSRSSTTTVNVVYDPFMDTTTTAAPTTTTTAAPEEEGGIWSDPVFIGVLAGLIGVSAILGAVAVFALCRYCQANNAQQGTAKRDYGYNSRSSTPTRPNRVSVQNVSPEVGRKISSLRPYPGGYV